MKRVIIIAAILLIIFAPYIKVEILTMLYGEQFEELHNASGWVDEINFYSVKQYGYIVCDYIEEWEVYKYENYVDDVKANIKYEFDDEKHYFY